MKKHMDTNRISVLQEDADNSVINIAVILPAFNEELTIKETITQFNKYLPEAEIFVVNNNSSDKTEQIAKQTIKNLQCKGKVINEDCQGKGNALRRAFLSIDADIYVISDADMTYPASQVQNLIRPVLNDEADMVVGDRHSGGHYAKENKRALHGFGNRLVQTLINKLFKAQLSDVMSGFRAFNKLFVKNYPILVGGFEIETDMTLHALDKRLRIVEFPIEYRDRPQGSLSKLNTFSDGAKVIFTIFQVLRFYKPLFFFTMLSILFFVSAGLASIPVFNDWVQHRYIYHVPLAILASGLSIVAIILLGTGLMLDSLAHLHKREYEQHLLKDSDKSV